jgi:hypothetical protein
VLSREFNLHELIEDELLMVCPWCRATRMPSAVKLASSDEDFEQANAQKPNPFAALAGCTRTSRQRVTPVWRKAGLARLAYNRGLRAKPLVSSMG